MRSLLAALALVAFTGCGKGPLTILCGGKPCDVPTNVCCVGTTDVTCTATCTGSPRFDCHGPTTCPGGICCVDDLGGHCVQMCNGAQKTACEKDADCNGMTCGTKSYVSSTGATLFSIGVCGGP